MPLRNLVIIVLTAIASLACYSKHKKDNDARIIYEALNVIDRNYYDEDLDRRELFEGALRGMVGQLDEHSAFISPDNYKRFQESLDQHFGGIGIMVLPKSDRLTVLSPLVDTPAHRAGIRAGDVILMIDKHSTEGMELDEAVALMRGRRGDPVNLLVKHVGEENPVEFTIKRDIIAIDSVRGDIRQPDGKTWEFVLEDDPRLGYVRLNTFGKDTTQELTEALEFNGRDAEALILDLRGNAGGLLTTAVDVCDMFIDSGMIVSTRGRGNVTKSEHRASSKVQLDQDIPMVVMTNRYSASASEIVAACLQDHRRAIVVGERTWGKGTVQNIIDLEGGKSALKITTASYWRPSGKDIHRRKNAKDEDEWGVQPDKGYERKLSDKEFARIMKDRRKRDLVNIGGEDSTAVDIDSIDDEPKVDEEPLDESFKDPQLQMAIEYLKQKIGSPPDVKSAKAG